MDFGFSEEQEFLRSTAREWFTNESPMSRVRDLMETDVGFDVSQYQSLAELGWQSMAIPEEYGGAGFSFLELAVLLEEMGRSLFPGPFFSSVVLGANALLLAGSEGQKQAVLSGIASGEATVAVAVSDDGGLWTRGNIRATATESDNGWVLTGVKEFVLNAHSADKLVIAAMVGDEVRLFLIDSGDAAIERVTSLDETRPMSTVRLAAIEVSESAFLPLGTEATVTKLGQIASVANALDQIGGAAATLEAAVQYAKDRKQFGRPIGSFQAIKHKCATMLQKVESAKAAAYYGAWCVAEDNDELAEVAAIAKSYCSEAYFHCASENIQITGGIGFTWEHDAHLYFKRATSSGLLFGSPAEHRQLLAGVLGL